MPALLLTPDSSGPTAVGSAGKTVAPSTSLPPIRLDRLNTLRACAIIGVFIYHIFSSLFARSPHGFEHAISNWTEPYHTLSQLVLMCLVQMHRLVIIFFLLSGYFLHRTFLQWQQRNPCENLLTFSRFFLWKRFWRLVPVFWIALLLSYFLTYQDPFALANLRKLAVNASLLKTLFPGYFFTVNYAHWYVAVQWQLDLLYPLFLYFIWRRSFKFAFVMACALALAVDWVAPHFTSAAYFVNLPFRWWAEWALGAYIAMMHSKDLRCFAQPRWAFLICAVGLAISFKFQFGLSIWVLSRLSLALLLESVILSQGRPLIIERCLAPIGLCSYSIYLLHLPLMELCLRVLNTAGFHIHSAATIVTFIGLSFAVCLAISLLSYRWIEEKSATFGSRCWKFFYPDRSARTGVLVAPYPAKPGALSAPRYAIGGEPVAP